MFQGAYSGSIPVPYETEWHSRRSPSFYFQLICLYYWLYVLLQPDPSAPRFLKFKGGRDPQGHSLWPISLGHSVQGALTPRSAKPAPWPAVPLPGHLQWPWCLCEVGLLQLQRLNSEFGEWSQGSRGHELQN